MADHPHIVIPLHVRYAVWPGGAWLLLEATAEQLGVGCWLLDQEGRSHELRAYSYRAWHRRR